MQEASFGEVMDMVVRVGVILFLFMENKQKTTNPRTAVLLNVYI